MEPDPTAPSVIELVLDVRLEYEVTLGTYRLRSQRPAPQTPRHTQRVQLGLQESKKRPIATVRPATYNRKRDSSEENELSKEDLKLLESSDITSHIIESDDNQLLDDSKSKVKYLTELEESQEKDLESKYKNDKESNSESQAEHRIQVPYFEEPIDRSVFFSTKNRSYRLRSQVLEDPCNKHRDFIRQTNIISYRKMECVDGHGCSSEPQHVEGQNGGVLQEDQREVPITECLEEFLAGLHLSHLVDYLRVLGCTCVRDMRLLETSELEAIQLVSRRRLLQQLDSLKLHHEAPPEDCSLEGWLTWYGLTHIAGFLKAIGVHSVGDLTYLRDEDLSLLKPVTRRRILACNKRWNKKSSPDRFGIKSNDYLM